MTKVIRVHNTPGYLALNYNFMTVVFLLILLSLVVAFGFLGAFLWAVRSGQYDDEYTPSVRILFDEKPKEND